MTTPAPVHGPRTRTALSSRSARAARPDDGARTALLVVVGGVPGAGKSTLLEHVGADVPRAVVLDPDRHRRRIAARLPSFVPYATYRWAVHALHTVATVLYLVRGPRSGRPLLLHDTATRERRRDLLGLLARWSGWDPVLVAVDVSLGDALDGQLDRGRVVQPDEFVRHWERWTAQRSMLASAAGGPQGPWSAVYLMERCDAFGQVRDLVLHSSPVVVGSRADGLDGPGQANPCAA